MTHCHRFHNKTTKLHLKKHIPVQGQQKVFLGGSVEKDCGAQKCCTSISWFRLIKIIILITIIATQIAFLSGDLKDTSLT